jgi:hypothetical protein
VNPNPDVAAAIPELERQGVLLAPYATTAARLAAGALLSVRGELRALLYGGVLLITAGVSLLVREQYERIGPVVIATAIGLAATGCLFWAARRAPAFTWGKAPAAGFALDYVLLLGALLAATDLAFVETQFAALGPNWAWHLLLVALGYGALAVRFDSRALFSLALSSFAAWRGVAVGIGEAQRWLDERTSLVRWNAIACGVAFLLLAWAMRRFNRKRHFEPVAAVLGWLLVLGAESSGLAAPSGWPWAAALFATGSGLAAYAVWRRRFGLFSLGALGGYAGLSYLALWALDDAFFGCGWFFATGGLVVAGLVLAQRFWFREGARP